MTVTRNETMKRLTILTMLAALSLGCGGPVNPAPECSQLSADGCRQLLLARERAKEETAVSLYRDRASFLEGQIERARLAGEWPSEPAKADQAKGDR